MSKNNLKTYERLLKEEANHWDEFEREMIEKNKVIPWWIDLRNASLVPPNSSPGLSPIKENFVRGQYKRQIIDACPAGSRVLDLGCGSGWLSLELARKGCQMTAVDISPYRIKLAQEFYQKAKKREKFVGTVTYICGDIGSISFNQQFDMIVAWDSLHHFPELDRLLTKLKKKLKKGGLFICYDHLGSKFIASLGKIRKIFVQVKISALEDVSNEEIPFFLEKKFKVLEKKYKITAPFRLLSFLLFRFDMFTFIVSPLVAIDEFVANKTKILGREFYFFKGENEN